MRSKAVSKKKRYGFSIGFSIKRGKIRISRKLVNISILIFLLASAFFVYAVTFIPNGATFYWKQDNGSVDFDGNSISIGQSLHTHNYSYVIWNNGGGAYANTAPLYGRDGSGGQAINLTCHGLLDGDIERTAVKRLNDTNFNSSYFSLKFRYNVPFQGKYPPNAIMFGGCYMYASNDQSVGDDSFLYSTNGYLNLFNTSSPVNWQHWRNCTTPNSGDPSYEQKIMPIKFNSWINITINFAFGNWEVYINDTLWQNSTLINTSNQIVNKVDKFGFSCQGDNDNLGTRYSASNLYDDVTLCSGVLNCTASAGAASDTTKPIINGTINNTAPRKNYVVNATFNATDEIGLSIGQVIVNQTGANQFFNYSLTGTTDKFSQSFTISCSRGCVINVTGRVNDSSNNFKQNSTLITIANTPPSAPTILYPQNNVLFSTTSIPLNVTFPADVDGDSITSIRYYINGVLNSTSTGNSTFNASNGDYTLNVSIFDGVEWSANTSINSFKLDTAAPTDNLPSVMTNITFIGRDRNITVQASDANLFGHNVTCRNASGQIKFSEEVINIAGTTNNIVVQLNISWGEGRGKCTSNESDDHTINSIKEEDYAAEKEIETVKAGEENYKLTYNPYENNEISLSLVEIRSDGQKIDVSELSAEDFGDEFKKDRKENYWDLTDAAAKIQNKGTEQITTIHEFIAEKKIFHRQAYSFPSFVTGYNWVDFKLCDENGNELPATYNVIKNSDLDYDIEVTADTLERRFCSIGGINFGSSESEYIIDLTPPVINNLTPILGNNSLSSALSVNYTLNASELNNESILAYVNGIKNLTIGTYRNGSMNISLNTATFSDGNFTVKFELNDSAGNKVNSSLFSFRIDRTAPIVINVLNRTTTGQVIMTTADNLNLSLFANDTNLDRGNISTNASGIWVNSSLIISGTGSYNTIISGLKGGHFAWTYHFFDSLGNKAEASFEFDISKISTSVGLSNNGFASDITTQPPVKTLATGVNGTPIVYANGSLVVQDVNNFYAVGYYNFTAIIQENETVRESRVTYFITMLAPSSGTSTSVGSSSPSSGSSPRCGDYTCNNGETHSSCPSDCILSSGNTSTTTTEVETEGFLDKIKSFFNTKESTIPDENEDSGQEQEAPDAPFVEPMIAVGVASFFLAFIGLIVVLVL